MPDLETAAKVASNYGLGVLSFLALLYGGWRLLNWLEKVSTWLEEIKSNHLHHLQASLDVLTKNSTDANGKLDEQTKKLDDLLKK